ncbi:MAG: sodium:solute symporter family protein, partial [Acidobacteriota bacterium]
MVMTTLDIAIVLVYVLFAITVGLVLSRRASRNIDQYFLSGRSLPWWLAGTSMVATTFAADTPLVITGWVRDYGIWKNWLWWTFAISTVLIVFLFSRLWRRAGVLTKAELTEMRYGGPGARWLRGALGLLHASVTNLIVLCWVLVAASKIAEVLFDIDKGWAVAIACAIAMSYSLLAGYWGVVLTDLVQFTIAMAGSIALAVISWRAIEGLPGLVKDADLGPETLRFLPSPGDGGLFDAAFWTAPIAVLAVNLGVGWWAAERADGDTRLVQRISSCRDERHGRLAVLWFAVSHYALRPWPWILVALASMAVLPHLEVTSPVAGTVTEIRDAAVVVDPGDGSTREILLTPGGVTDDWRPLPSAAGVGVGDAVEPGQLLARTDSERAYPVMMARYLPAGLLGLVVASLFAAFMSTIDTHVNLASSFFVNDIYRRFLNADGAPRHYVTVARVTSLCVMVCAGILAYFATSISDLFTFFLAFLSGVGPVYILRWLWWRVQASTEIVAMATSVTVTSVITLAPIHWSFGPLADGGQLAHEGRLLIVVGCSLAASLLSLLVAGRPDPKSLVGFYEHVRPPGAWGPVRELADVASSPPPIALPATLAGVAGGLLLIYGLLFALGHYLLGGSGGVGPRPPPAGPRAGGGGVVGGPEPPTGPRPDPGPPP